MIVGYCRISTDAQNLDLQIRALNEAGCEKIYSDVASGARQDRVELQKCLAFLQPGDTLVCWKLDRISRSMQQLVNTIADFNEKSIGFKVLTAPIDTTTAQGKLVFGIFAALAEFERSLIKERINAGIAAAKSRGVRFGRESTVTPEKLAMVDRMVGSVRQKAAALGVSKSALYRSL